MEALSSRELTKEQMGEAEAGLRRILRAKRFPREWIERQVPEVMALAYGDLAKRIAAGREDETVNLLVVIAYRQALKVLTKQLSDPATTSIEAVFNLADPASPSPEREVIEDDRRARLVGAMRHLPERDRRLLALVYFGEMSVREAGRRLGWGKSAADRHHQAALGRMRALVGDPTLLGAEIAVPAMLAGRPDSLLRAALMWIEGVAETVREAVTLGGARLVSAVEAGNLAATSGAGRAATGVCGVVVIACLAGAATGALGPAVGVPQLHGGHRAAEPPPVRLVDVPRSSVGEPAVPILGLEAARSAEDPEARIEGVDYLARRAARAAARRQSHGEGDEGAATAKSTPGERTAAEFGIEAGGEGSAAEPPAPSSTAPPISRGARSAPPPPSAPSQAPAASQVHSEFGF